LFSDHHVALICNFFAYQEHLQRRPWTSGPPCFSSFMAMSLKRLWIMSLLNSSTAIANVKLTSIAIRLKLRNSAQQRRCQMPFPGLTILYLSLGGWSHRPALPRFILEWICTTSATPPLVRRSTSGIVKLTFVCHPPRQSCFYIPHSGYISPEALEAMATCLSMLTRLESSAHFRILSVFS